MNELKFKLIGLKKFTTKDKFTYYKLIIIDNASNVIEILVDKIEYDYFSNQVNKDITDKIVFSQRTIGYNCCYIPQIRKEM